MKKIGLVLIPIIGLMILHNFSSASIDKVNIISEKNISSSNLTNDTEFLIPIEKPEDSKQNYDQKRKILVCIDPGHQKKGNYELEPIGPGSNIEKPKVSSGTIGSFTGIPEYVFNLVASLKLMDELEEKGINVILTRDSHDVNISNKERAEIANKANADLFVRIHADGSNNNKDRGIHILLPSEKSEYTKEIFQDSKDAAIEILYQLENDFVIKNSPITYRDDISGFNWSQVPVILIEMGFMTNKEDDLNLSNEDYLDSLIKKIALGVESYLIEKEK